MSVLMAIDPGSSKSAYVIVETDDYSIKKFGKIDNKEMLDIIGKEYYDDIAIEWLASYGRPVGAEVFDTAMFVGRIYQIAVERGIDPDLVLRRVVKKHLLGKASGKEANDKAIRMALIERFATFDKENGKGTKYEKDFFYGFSADEWAAEAVAVTWIDQQKIANCILTGLE